MRPWACGAARPPRRRIDAVPSFGSCASRWQQSWSFEAPARWRRLFWMPSRKGQCVCGRVVVRSRTWFNSKVGNNCQMFGELGRHQASCRANWVGPSSRSLASRSRGAGHCTFSSLPTFSLLPPLLRVFTNEYTNNRHCQRHFFANRIDYPTLYNQVTVLTGTPKSMTTSGGKTKLKKHSKDMKRTFDPLVSCGVNNSPRSVHSTAHRAQSPWPPWPPLSYQKPQEPKESPPPRPWMPWPCTCRSRR